MTYFLFGTAILGGLFCKKSHIVSIYIISVMLLLSVYKYNVADLGNYQIEYEMVLKSDGEQFKYIGYFFFAFVCSKLKMTFYQYLFAYYLISFILMFIAISRLTVNVNRVMSMYLIYPFGIDAIQMKTMMADTWVLFGLTFLIKMQENENGKYKDIILFVIFSVIGSLFHFSVIFFIPVCFVLVFIDINKYKKYIFMLEILLIIAIYLDIIPQILSVICNSLHFGSVDHMLNWMERKTRLGWIVPSISVVICIIYSLLQKSTKNIRFKNNKFNLFYKYLMYSACFLIPFFLYDVTFVRLMRIYVIVVYIQFVEKGICAKKELGIISISTHITFQKVFSVITLLALIGYMYWYEIYPNIASTLGGLLHYNRII